jgi:hypothetical protein
MVANLNATVIYHRILTLENVGNAENCHGIFITLARSDKRSCLLHKVVIYTKNNFITLNLWGLYCKKIYGHNKSLTVVS